MLVGLGHQPLKLSTSRPGAIAAAAGAADPNAGKKKNARLKTRRNA